MKWKSDIDRREYQANWARKRYVINREKLNLIKTETGCTDCGFNKYPESLDFDHLPGTKKKFNIAHTMTRNWKTLEEEIAKCEVVCANCHRHRTQLRREKSYDLL